MAVDYRISPTPDVSALQDLMGRSWDTGRMSADYAGILSRSLCHIWAYDGKNLIGFVNVAWDGGDHAFILDTTVDPMTRRCGIGRRLIRAAVAECRRKGLTWLHVDFEAHLKPFYDACGFRATQAGLIDCRQ